MKKGGGRLQGINHFRLRLLLLVKPPLILSRRAGKEQKSAFQSAPSPKPTFTSQSNGARFFGGAAESAGISLESTGEAGGCNPLPLPKFYLAVSAPKPRGTDYSVGLNFREGEAEPACR